MFSGASTPQHTTRRSARSSRAPSAFGLGSTPAPSGSPAPSTLHGRTLGSNLAPANHSRALSASPVPPSRARSAAARSAVAVSEVGSAMMDVDGGGGQHREPRDDKVLVKDEHYSITERKNLPLDVRRVVEASDPYTRPVKGTLDPITGFGLLVSSEWCYVWNAASRTPSATTYTFPLPPQAALPPNVQVFSPLPFASLVPSPSQTRQQQGQREPGLLVVSNTGEITFWDQISLSLSGVDRFKSASAPLNPGELVRDLVLLAPTTYLLSTSQARIIAINIVPMAGRADLSVRVLERALGWAGSVWSAVFGAKAVDPRAGILALAASQPKEEGTQGEGERTVYAVMEKDLQVWKVPVRGTGGEHLVVELDLFAGVLGALAGEKVGNEQWALNEGQVQVVDAAVTSEDRLAVLLSHVHGSTAAESRSYAVVQFEIGSSPDSLRVAGLSHLSYQSRPDPRPLSTPKLSIGTGEIAFVVFADAVVLMSLSNDSSFEEAFPLRSNSNRFIGASMPSYLPPVPSAVESISLLTSSASSLTVTVSPPQGNQLIASGSEGYKTRRLQTRLEQAIFFGTQEVENPFAFDLQPDYEGDLATAALAVSAGILASSSSNMPAILDLRVQLADRVKRSKALIEFINANGLLGKLPKQTRQQLSWHAEKLEAAVALWQQQNARIASGTSTLANAVLQYMDQIGEGFGEDPLRLFFRTKLAAIGTVLETVSEQTKALFEGHGQFSAEEKALLLLETNQVLLGAFDAVSRHRSTTAKHYGLDGKAVALEPWSSRAPLLDALQWQLHSTDVVLRERTRDLGVGSRAAQQFGASASQDVKGELQRQLALLADVVFTACEERIAYLEVALEDGNAPDVRSLREHYLAIRPRVIEVLVSNDQIAAAFQVAEQHRDFDSLVRLANDPDYGSKARVNGYLDTHGRDFSFPLYTFYLAEGNLRTLLEPEEAHRDLLTEFLDTTDNDRLAWINDIAIDRYDRAKAALDVVAATEESVAQKKLILSLEKLTQLAQVDRTTIETETMQRALEAVDDSLDIVRTQEALSALFASRLSGSEARLPPSEQGAAISSRIAPSLHDRPAFSNELAGFCARLFEGRILSTEDLVDVLTLKENVNEQAGDFGSALDILVRAKDVPEARRRTALASIWRRVYIQDDWASLKSSAGLTDEEMTGALRNTAFFATLKAGATSDVPKSMYLEPAQSFSTANATEISARSPNLSPEEVQLVLQDYEQENTLLHEALQHGLESYCQECLRLQQEENSANGGEEVCSEVIMVE
ncbi:methyltransferase type 11 [Rhodotorula sp. JG-1b]|nr:methyltransferase type 11 [Rhodotorula sp. JG-1b]